MPFELLVALRYLSAKRKAGVSATGMLTVLGVALGVMALIVVTSVWNGFQAEFLEKLLGINAHAIVLPRYDVFRDHREVAEALEARPDVEAAAPFVYSEVIIQGPNGARGGVALKGVDPEQSLRLPLAQYVGAQAPAVFGALEARSSTAAPGILVGNQLKETLKVERGDSVSIVTPYGGRGSRARSARFEVVGFFHSGMHEFDSKMTFIALSEAQRFFGLRDTVTGLEVWTRDPLSSYDTLNQAVETLEPEDPFAFEVKDWSRTNAGIFGAVQSQKSLISVVLFFIVIVAAFNIMATLILLILEKAREIAVLKSLGATRRSILTIFVIDGQLVGAIGCGLGIAMGLVSCAVLQQHGLKLDPRVYYLESFPIVIEPLEVTAVAAGAMALATLATLFPAVRAARTHPVDGLTQRGARRGPDAAR